MPSADAGLSKRRKAQKSESFVPSREGIEPPKRFTSNSGLRVVDAERRSVDRLIAPDYGRRLPMLGPYGYGKRIFDVFGASALIILLSPLILGLVAFSFTTGGAPFFKHRRVGRNGVFFDCLKFRTMVTNADFALQELLRNDVKLMKEWVRDHKLREDPRITRFGKFLRKTSLDELPQLWNVLKGDMSLVGPRPVVPDELRRYGTMVAVLLSASPGITGLWQVSGRNNNHYRRRVALDVCYVRSRSLRLDLYILLRTLPAVFAKHGAY